MQSSSLRIVAQGSPDAISNISRARRASSARPARLLARRLSSMRSASDRVIVLMATIILPFYLLQSTSDVRERVCAALHESVARHLVADVPIGVFLSGALTPVRWPD